MIWKVRTDFGDYTCTPEEAAVFQRAPKRGNGQLDMRYQASRAAAKLEREILERETR